MNYYVCIILQSYILLIFKSHFRVLGTSKRQKENFVNSKTSYFLWREFCLVAARMVAEDQSEAVSLQTDQSEARQWQRRREGREASSRDQSRDLLSIRVKYQLAN